jgi:hypothetical protein
VTNTVFQKLLESSHFQDAMPRMYRNFKSTMVFSDSNKNFVEFSNGFHEYTSHQTRSWPVELRTQAGQDSIYKEPVNHHHSISGSNLAIPFNVNESKLSQEDYYSIYSSIFYTEPPAESENDLLIPGLRYLSNNYLIFEMPPTHKVINYKEAYREDDSSREKEFFIPIPWQVYIAVFDPDTMRLLSVQMYFSNSPLTSFNQNIYLPPILNFYSSGMLCRPFFETIEDIEKYPKNITGVFASAYDWIWNSGYNFDIVEPISEFICSPRFKGFLDLIPDTPDNQFIKHTLRSVVGPSNHLGPTYVHHFFKLWQQLDLFQVTNLQWTPFCVEADFFGSSSTVYDEQIFNDFLNNNSFVLTEYYDDESDPDDGYITEEDALNHSEYRAAIRAKVAMHDTTLLDALKVSERFMVLNKIVTQNFSNSSSFRSFINKIFSKISSFV